MEDDENSPLLIPGTHRDVPPPYQCRHPNDSMLYYDCFPSHTPKSEYGENKETDETGSLQKFPDGINPSSAGEFRVYKRRWYILVIFSMYAFCQNCVWNTWGPISATAEDVFGWHDSTIAWMSNWGPISYILSGLFFPWLLQVKGLKWAVITSTLCVAFGSTMRVFTSQASVATILIHIGQFLNGLGGPIGMGAMPHLSATWFPPNERVTATALGTAINVFGGAFSFVIGPLLVTHHDLSNSSSSGLSGMADFAAISRNTSEHFIEQEREQIMRFMYYSCGFCWLICLCILAYFPSAPPHPPAFTAITTRDSYWTGMLSLAKKKPFLVVAFTYGISLGVMNCWTSVLDVNLKPFGVGETEAGWIGFYSVLGGCVVSLLIGRFADYFIRYMKLTVVILYVFGVAALVVFAIMLIHVIPFSHVLLYSTVIIGTTTLNAAVPLLFELACELAYPTSEGAANGLLTYLNNFAGLVFLAVFSFPHIGTMWMNWTVIGSTAVCIPLIALLRGRFRRHELDEQVRATAVRAGEQEIVVNAEDGSDAMTTSSSSLASS